MLAMEPFMMMDPPSGISCNAFCTVKSVPLTLTLKTLSKPASVTDPMGTLNSPMPALAKRISTRPFSALTFANRRSRSARFPASPCTPVTFLPISLTAVVQLFLPPASNENVCALFDE